MTVERITSPLQKLREQIKEKDLLIQQLTLETLRLRRAMKDTIKLSKVEVVSPKLTNIGEDEP